MEISGIIPFLITKAHANHSQSPTMGQINNMVTAERMVDVESILTSTSYSKILDEVRPSVNLSGFEIAMRRDYARLLSLYRRASRGDVARLLDAYAMMIEAENMDMIFQAIQRDNVTEELEQIIIPVGKFGMRHYRRIMENTDMNAATDFIIYPELKRAAQKAIDRSTDPDEQIFYLGSALSHASFSVLADVAPNWIKLEADFLNLETICRAIKLGIDPEPWLIPDIGVVYHQRAGLYNMGSAQDVISYMMSKFPVSRPLQAALEADDPVVRLEDEALKYLYYQRKRQFALYGNRKEAILDFFSIKLAEIEDISRILLAKLRSIPADRVRSMLYPIYKRN